MIMFKEDWDKYPNAIIDENTRNKSFLELAAKYRGVGVKNHAFLLALHDKELIGVDPYAANLSRELIARIVIECKRNYWYFIREVVRVPEQGSANTVMLNANRGNISFSWLFFNGVTTILIQIRQTGKSLITRVLHNYLLNVKCLNTHIAMVTKDEKARTNEVKAIKDMGLKLPEYLQMMDSKKDIDNTNMFTIKRLGNKYSAHLSGRSKEDATKLLRNLTIPIAHFDEFVHIPNIHIGLSPAIFTMNAAIDIAKRNNTPHGLFMTTTTGYLDQKEGAFAYRYCSNSATWSEIFFDRKNKEDLYNVIAANSSSGGSDTNRKIRNIRVNCTFNHRQLGYTDDWLREKISLASTDADVNIEADLLNRWIPGQMDNPIDKALLSKLDESLREDFVARMLTEKDFYIIRWYVLEHEIPKLLNYENIILSIDPSEGIGKDDIALYLRDVRTGRTLAAMNINETNTFAFIHWLFKWIVTYPQLTLIIETKSTGVGIQDGLIELCLSNNINPFTRMFNWVVQEEKENSDRARSVLHGSGWKNSSLVNKYKKEFGYSTSGTGKSSRDNLYKDSLIPALKHTADVVYDRVLIDQIKSLTVKHNRIDHSTGKKDDLCVAWLLSYWFLTQGKNLHHYGINANDALVDITRTHEDEHNKKIYYEQVEIRNKLTEYINELLNTKDDFIADRLERRIQLLSTELDTSSISEFNIDSMINNIKVARKARMRK